MQVQKFTVQYAKRINLLALATEDEPFCSYTPYLLWKALTGQQKRLSLLLHGCSRWIRCSLWEGWETFLPCEQLNMFSCRAVWRRQPILFPQPNALYLHSMQRVDRFVWSVLSAKLTLKIACLRAKLDRGIHLQRQKSRVYKFSFLFCHTEYFQVPLFKVFILYFYKTQHQRFKACLRVFGMLIYRKGTDSFTSKLE